MEAKSAAVAVAGSTGMEVLMSVMDARSTTEFVAA
jgi:hypothetical protein